MKTVLILGATSHIAKNLILNYHSNYNLVLFARNIVSLTNFLNSECISVSSNQIWNTGEFAFYNGNADVIINCIGFGTPSKVKSAGLDQFLLTEKYDNLILELMATKNGLCYINFSSGAVYGTEHDKFIDMDSEFKIKMNNIVPDDAYRVSKLNAEAKHRSIPHFNIIDLRLFSFISQYIEMDTSFLICDMISKIQNDQVFETGRSDIVRDYIHPFDLCQFVTGCIETPFLNVALDLYSAAPLKKIQLIDFVQKKYQLQIRYIDTDDKISPTGIKNWYVSANHSAHSVISYTPKYTSLNAIEDSLSRIIGY